MLIQANIQAPCTLLDFPSLDRFIEEIRDKHYDIVGISSIITNWLKVRKMCELVRQYLPDATIVVGGHIANLPDLGTRIDADQIVKGEGIAWFRGFLGEDPDSPIRHPQVSSAFGTRFMGVDLTVSNVTSAVLIPSVGCPMGCNFCSTSAMFGGKGKFVDFYETGDELFDIMCQLETSMDTQAFFVMDENFLLHRRRALRLIELMERHDKSWSLHVFSSANALRSYSIDQLLSLGISGVWMGLEGAEQPIRQAARDRRLRLGPRTAVARNQCLRFDDHRAGRSDSSEYRRCHRLRRALRHRLPPVHALHSDSGYATSR